MFGRSSAIGLILIVILQVLTKSVKTFGPYNPYNPVAETVSIVSNDINEFSLRLYKAIIENETGNLISSTFSVWALLSTIALGTNTETRYELESRLNHKPSIPMYYYEVQRKIKSLNFDTDAYVRLANRIFVKNWMRIDHQFQTIAQSVYDSEIQLIDFRNTQAACGIINNWVSQNTRGFIQNIISPDKFNKDSNILLISALYFEGKWVNKFDPYGTRNRLFYLEDGTTKPVPTMYVRNNFKYEILDYLGATIIELPYESVKSISMFVVVPNKDVSLRFVEMNIMNVNLPHLMRDRPKEIELLLPKFTIESEIDLIKPLQKLGIRKIFGPLADFSNLTKSGPLQVSNIIQKVKLEITETGTVAAAVSEGQLHARMTSTNLISVNRPFLVFIYMDDLALFTGRIVDPISDRNINNVAKNFWKPRFIFEQDQIIFPKN